MAIRMMEVLMGKKTAVILPNFSSPFHITAFLVNNMGLFSPKCQLFEL